MFFEGAPRLVNSGVMIPVLQPGDPERIVVEAYPGKLARQLIGRAAYKNDTAGKQTEEQHQFRCAMLRHILNGAIKANYGLSVEAQKNLADDPSGDQFGRAPVCDSSCVGVDDERMRLWRFLRCLLCLRAGSPIQASVGLPYLHDLPYRSRLTPSCGGGHPYRRENSGPGKDDRGEFDTQTQH